MESLPTEVLECIFSFLQQDSLDSCFQVCDRWAEVIDKMPKKTIWNPWLANNNNPAVEAMLIFRHTAGSKFESAEDIAEMRNKISKLTPSERTKNPFKNRTLIINMKNTKDFTALHQDFPEMIKEFGGHVHHILYYVNHLVPQSVENLQLVFKNLCNVRSVTFYSMQMNIVIDSVRKWDMSTFPILPHFSELDFLGYVGIEYLEVFANVYGPQIRNLSLRSIPYNEIGGDFVRIVGKFPNLNFLKIFQLDPQVLYRRCLNPIPIKHLSISVERYRVRCEIKLFEIMESLGTFSSEEFEILTLFWNPKTNCKVCSCDFDGYKISPSYVPKSLKELAIPLALLGTHEFWELLLNFSNLRKLMLLDTEDTFKNKVVGKEELQNLCEPLWLRLSCSLETISIRSRTFSKKFKRYFPVVFICSRSQQ